MNAEQPTLKSGLVALAGPPNTGKSTLLNRLIGQKIAIVSPKPQTTRVQMLGVLNGDGYQIVLVDTPGLHQGRGALNKEMMRAAQRGLAEVDLALFLVDAHEKPSALKTEELRAHVQAIAAPVILLFNKIDLLPKDALLPLIDFWRQTRNFAAIIPISALTGQGLDAALKEVVARLPYGPRYFPDDAPTDASERFLAAEIIREKIFLRTGQEVPYATAVVVESFTMDTPGHATIHAAIVVEKDSQKAIVIGKGGKKLKEIGILARKEIEVMLEARVMLKLWVKVKKDWTEDQNFLQELGFSPQH
ncbi:MAG: GTPase Era [Desulfobulbaceae bacterium]|jgi:GTP-binding protein Era|nr:GTPase Era [Desulfobulbaceae bacterium]